MSDDTAVPASSIPAAPVPVTPITVNNPAPVPAEDSVAAAISNAAASIQETPAEPATGLVEPSSTEEVAAPEGHGNSCAHRG